MTFRKTRILTGITTSGTPHLGNYVGAIRPAVAASRAPDAEGFYFLADLHALVKVQDPARVQRSTLEIAATWLACGLDPGEVWFYRQSDIPEITELAWMLTCVAGKGILNRAHAYKAAVDRNRADGEDDDAGINAGLFMYPVLMSADILLFNADKVPVGRDQVQHIEMARDFGQRFNHLYGEPEGQQYFRLPEAVIEENVATLPGLDGRKMSKSYDNTIPLFAPQATLRKLIASIVTDSRLPGEAKDADSSHVFQLYRAFAGAGETAAMRREFEQGIGWGEAKQRLFERVDSEVAPLRERYEALMAEPHKIERLLRDGAHRLRERHATPLLRELRAAVGLRDLSQAAGGRRKAAAKAALPQFKQYRDDDGRFHFKLVDAEGALLLQGGGHASAREAGQLVARLKQGAGTGLRAQAGAVWLDEQAVGELAEGVALEDIAAALAALAETAA
jgi:tryptophanyl-tRNA synthetase